MTSPTCQPIPIFVDWSIVTSQRNTREAVPSDMLQSCFVQCHRLPCCEYFLAALVAYNILVCIKHFQITFCKVGRYFLSSMILAACEAESFLLFFSRFFRPQICLAPQHEKIANLSVLLLTLFHNKLGFSFTYVCVGLPSKHFFVFWRARHGHLVNVMIRILANCLFRIFVRIAYLSLYFPPPHHPLLRPPHSRPHLRLIEVGRWSSTELHTVVVQID